MAGRGRRPGCSTLSWKNSWKVRGRELVRRLFQGHLDLLAAREDRRDRRRRGRTGWCGRGRERGRTRPLVTRFGQVSVSRIAYRSPGRGNVHPLDAALEPAGGEALPRAAQARRDRGGARLDGGGRGRDHPRGRRDGKRKRQVEEAGPPLRRPCGGVLRAAGDRARAGGNGRSILDFRRRKGIVMLPGALVPGHREGRGIRGGQARYPAVTGREERPQSRMAEAGLRLRRGPGPARPRGCHQHPGAETAEEESAGHGPGEEGEAAGAAGQGQVADRLGHRRHPRRHRRRVR